MFLSEALLIITVLQLGGVVSYVAVNENLKGHGFKIDLQTDDVLSVCGHGMLSHVLNISLTDTRPWVTSSTIVAVQLAYDSELKKQYINGKNLRNPLYGTEQIYKKQMNIDPGKNVILNNKFCVEIRPETEHVYDTGTLTPVIFKRGLRLNYPFINQFILNDFEFVHYNHDFERLHYLYVVGAKQVYVSLNDRPLRKRPIGMHKTETHIIFDLHNRAELPLRDPLSICVSNVKKDLDVGKFYIRLIAELPSAHNNMTYLNLALNLDKGNLYADYNVRQGFFSADLSAEHGGQHQIDIPHVFPDNFCIELEVIGEFIYAKLENMLIDEIKFPFHEAEEPLKYLKIDGLPVKANWNVHDETETLKMFGWNEDVEYTDV